MGHSDGGCARSPAGTIGADELAEARNWPLGHAAIVVAAGDLPES